MLDATATVIPKQFADEGWRKIVLCIGIDVMFAVVVGFIAWKSVGVETVLEFVKEWMWPVLGLNGSIMGWNIVERLGIRPIMAKKFNNHEEEPK